MVLTRSGKKRELDGGGGKPAPTTNKKAKMSCEETAALSPPKSEKEKKKKGLLDMPPEIRNRIYKFASEPDDYDGYGRAVPLINYCCEIHRHVDCPDRDSPDYRNRPSARNYLGLTQTCKLLRQEYRPIWLSQSCIRVTSRHIGPYVHTFYGCQNHWTIMPKLVQVSYNHEEDTAIDLCDIFRMRAASNTLKIEFVPHELTLPHGLWDWMADSARCNMCMLDTSGRRTRQKRRCPHVSIHRENCSQTIMEEEYPYLDDLNNFLNTTNSAWLNDIKSREIVRVRLDMCPGIDSVVCILVGMDPTNSLISEQYKKSSFRKRALNWLHSRDLFDSEYLLEFRLVVSLW